MCKTPISIECYILIWIKKTIVEIKIIKSRIMDTLYI